MNTVGSTTALRKFGIGGWLLVFVSTATVVLSTCVLPSDIQPTIELNLSADSVRVGLGASTTAPVEVLANGAAYGGVLLLLESDDSSIVAVDTGGAVFGVRRGTAVVDVQLVSSASGGGTLPSAQFVAKVVAASLDVVPHSSDTITALGDSVRFVPVVRDADGDAVDDTVSCLWHVSDSTLVSVNASGWVTAHRAGEATVTATAPWDDKSGSHAVTVVQEVSAVEVYPAWTDTLTAIGDTASFVARARDRNDSTVAAATFTWQSDDAAVVTVTVVDSKTALVTAQGCGSAEITASTPRLAQSADSVSGRDTVVVHQVPDQAVLTGPDSMPGGEIGGPFMLTSGDANGHATPVNVATLFDLSSTSPDATFFLDAAGSTPASTLTIAAGDSTVAFHYRDIRPGPQTITATWTSGDGIGDATYSVTVVTVAVWLAVTPAGPSISGVGDAHAKQLAVEVRDGSGFVIPSPDVTWTSLNPWVAAANQTGLVTPMASGQVTVCAEVDAVKGCALVTVTSPTASPLNLWTPTTSGMNESLGDVWGVMSAHSTTSSDVYAVGTNGTVLQYGGSGWSVVASGTTQDLNGVWGTSSTDIYVVGASGTVLHNDGSSFTAMSSGTTEHLLGVWGSSPNDVYAVGATGTILHYDGGSWGARTSGTTESLYGVWGTSANDVFMVGADGTILHWYGNSWSAQTSGMSEDLFAVWGTSADDVYAVGSLGTILHYDGTNWSADVSGTTEALQAVWGTASSDVVAVGASGTLVHYDGTAWSDLSTVGTQGLLGAWGASTSEAFAVGTAGTILRGYRGATVTVTPDAPPTLVSINETVQLSAGAQDRGGTLVSGVTFTWSSDDETVATVDAIGLVTAVANGTATITATAPGGASGSTTIILAQEVASVAVSPAGASVSGVGTTQQLSVEARDAGGSVIPAPSLSVVWTSLNTYVATVNPTSGLATAVAAGQVTIEADVDGVRRYALLTVSDPAVTPVSIWNTVESGTTYYLSGGWAASPSDVFALGPPIRYYDGTTWTSFPTPQTNLLNDIWGTSPGDLYLVGYEFAGDRGTIHHYDGANWAFMASATGESLSGVWGSSPTDIYAVGGNGTILHYDGTSWTPMTSGTTLDLKAVWGLSPTDVYAVGEEGMEEGAVLHYDGTGWSLLWSGTVPAFNSVWGSSGTDIYVAGAWDQVLHYDGVDWSLKQAGFDFSGGIHGVWGGASNDVYVLASQPDSAAIFYYDGNSWSHTLPAIPVELFAIWGAPSGDVFAVGRLETIIRGYRGATVTVTPEDTRLNAISETVQLAAQAKDREGGLIAGLQYTWSVDNEAVVSVGPNGLVTATGTGLARITAEAPGGAADTVTVRVIPAADSLEVSPSGTSIAGVGTTQQFTVQAWDASGEVIASPAVTWTSLNTNVATIHPTTGLATAVASGQVTIAAMVDGIVKYALLTVAVPGVAPVTIWSTMYSAGNALYGVWGTSDSDIFAVDGGRGIHHYDGTSWDFTDIGGGLSFRSVWGTSATDVTQWVMLAGFVTTTARAGA